MISARGKKILISCFLWIAATWITFAPIPVLSQASPGQVEVEVEVGPRFDGGDETTGRSCLRSAFGSRFPFDFIGFFEPLVFPSNTIACPTLNIYDNEHQFCWVVDIFESIRPAVTLGFFIYAIFNL